MKLRDSGIPWLGELPAHWDLWKVGHLARVGNGSTPERDNTEYWTDGSLPWLNSSIVNQAEVTTAEQFVTELARKECHLPLLHPGTVLIAITGQGKTRGQAVVLSIEATINQHMAFVAPNPTLIAAWFLRWALYRAYKYLRSISDDAGGTKGALTCEDVASLKIPVPPLAEQRAIVARLAHETARLDALLAAKQRLLALLAEKRKAIIATAVTRGLDPKVKLRDSGVPWLGQIPAHWSLVPLRYLLKLGPKNGISPQQAGPDGVLSFSISAVRDGRATIEGNEKYVALDRSVASSYYLNSGDILLVRGNGNLSLVGTCGLLETAPEECTYPDILMLMRVGERVIADLLVAAINSPYVRQQIESLAQTTNGTYKLSGEDVRTLQIALPPVQEQHAIVEYIARETAKIDAVRAATERTIALLKERRSALIAAAVTGQLDVGTAA